MTTSWTAEQVLALAPDAASIKAGRGLATLSKWSGLGQNEQALWGEAKGSGKKPYLTRIDLGGPAFKCSCPSRKFPCKHGIGLFLVFADQAAAFTGTDAPDWVTEWLEQREDRAEKQAKRKVEAADKPVDEKAQAKRRETREKKIDAGVGECQQWLSDLVRMGFASAKTQGYEFWDRMGSRLVDAQAPGLARHVRGLVACLHCEDWQERLLTGVGRLHTILQGWTRRASLSDDHLADLHSEIGLEVAVEKVLERESVRDTWQVLGATLEKVGKLRVQRTWLLGRETRRAALILSFAAGSQPLETVAAAGMAYDAELCFYPGSFTLRAVLKQAHGLPVPLSELSGALSIEAGLEQRSGWLEQNPFVGTVPMVVVDAAAVRREDGDWLVDGEGRAIRIAPRFEQIWEFIALCGGRPAVIAGEWDGFEFAPLGVLSAGLYDLFSGSTVNA